MKQQFRNHASAFPGAGPFGLRHLPLGLVAGGGARLSFAAGLLVLLATLSASGMSGTSQVASPGRLVTAEADWPAGTLELVNDPSRANGWNPWFTEWPNDVNHYEFKPISSADLNRLLTLLGAIKAERVCLILSPEAEPRGLGFSTRLPQSNGVVAVFAIGCQARIDEWYKHLPEGAFGTRKFGVHTFTEPPKATPPTLTLYVGNPVVNLAQLKLPPNVTVTSIVTEKERSSGTNSLVIKAIDGFMDQNRLRNSTAPPTPAAGTSGVQPPAFYRSFTQHPGAAATLVAGRTTTIPTLNPQTSHEGQL